MEEGVVVMHKYLGQVCITPVCEELQHRNPDPTTCFVEYDHEVIEVTKSLVTLPTKAVEEGTQL